LKTLLQQNHDSFGLKVNALNQTQQESKKLTQQGLQTIGKLQPTKAIGLMETAENHWSKQEVYIYNLITW
jgi:hypothetical protein